MRTAFSVVNPCRKAQPQNTGCRTRSRNIHLRYLKYAVVTCNRNLSESRGCVLCFHMTCFMKLIGCIAIVALSPSSDNSYLAYSSPVPSPTSLTQNNSAQPPTSAAPQTGDVLLFSTRSLTVANVIQAHKSPISFLSINSTGTMLATASEKGTVIRVWSIPGAEKLYQFRRGTREAKIYSINFNLVSSLLAVSSAHDTVHIFKLGPQKPGNGSSSSSSKSLQSPASPSASIDSREGTHGLDGGYEAYAEKKKGSGVSYVILLCRSILRSEE